MINGKQSTNCNVNKNVPNIKLTNFKLAGFHLLLANVNSISCKYEVKELIFNNYEENEIYEIFFKKQFEKIIAWIGKSNT